MFAENDLRELMTKGREDGVKLFKVAGALYTVCIGLNWILGILGVAGSLFAASAASNAGGYGAVVALIGFGLTAVFCLIIYAAAVMGSYVAKVLVHLLFSNLAMLYQPTGEQK